MKARALPLIILILAALLRRLPKSHPRYSLIEEEHCRRIAGHHGEESLDYYLRSLPHQNYFILHDLNLPDGEFICQIDTMIITPGCIYLIGVKHMAGELEFDTTLEQFLQTKDGQTKGYRCPVAQEQRHKAYVQELLAANHFPNVPIDFLITLTNPYCTFKVTGQNAHKVRPHVANRIFSSNDSNSLNRTIRLSASHKRTCANYPDC
ncbi:nuclease-related domain-containing protein [Neobacillus niacini]|uniref:nuclease-related domain-containing protein n=1 Tax=Neobacillus niacini TaxID=86668 RepID=UPI0021CB93EF|nr:nuclease-related domain-containing protein [Neobacillus niacini]MCM3763949.1 NERD domain-containing protein [Neobacillus niacini]